MNPDVYFGGHRVGICFSGGLDSTYLLYLALSSGANVVAFYADTLFDRPEDRMKADELCAKIGVRLVHVPVEMPPEVLANSPDRCYVCKTAIMSAIREGASKLGCSVIVDGTNASDLEDDRPGMRVLRELGIDSPLREWGLTKDEIRARSRDAGLPGWDRPSNSCVATRVFVGTPINNDILNRVAEAERLVGSLGLEGFRVRTDGTNAMLRVKDSDYKRASSLMPEIERMLSPLFRSVGLDDVTRN